MDYADYDIAPAEITDVETSLFPDTRSMAVPKPGGRQAVVAVVEDGIRIFHELWAICEFLDIVVIRVPSRSDLNDVLGGQNPMAVVCELDGAGQDGCHVMKTVARHNPSLPIMIVTGSDPILIGAADAVAEIWGLTEVTQTGSLPSIAGLVDFLFHAGRVGGCLRLVPARR
jgi:hypothetical protein